MITEHRWDLRAYSYGDCWQLAPSLWVFCQLAFHKYLRERPSFYAVYRCPGEVVPAEDTSVPAKLKTVCREVSEECGPKGLRFRFYYRYPLVPDDLDYGAALLTEDCFTAGVVHYSKRRWPPTFFLCLSRLPGSGILLTTDMWDRKFPLDFNVDILPYDRFYAEDVFDLHRQRTKGKELVLLEDSQLGEFIAEVQNRYADYYLRRQSGGARVHP